MLKIATKISQISYSQLMDVYDQSNQLDARLHYSNLDHYAALINAQQDLYHYLKAVFFSIQGSALAIWEEKVRYVSALRYELFEDGFLITALETAPKERGKGYARKLLKAAAEKLAQEYGCPVYSHVDRNNAPSLACHAKCGFTVSSDVAVFLDGSNHPECFTMIYEPTLVVNK